LAVSYTFDRINNGATRVDLQAPETARKYSDTIRLAVPFVIVRPRTLRHQAPEHRDNFRYARH